LIAFTAMRPLFGFSKGRDVSLCSVAQASVSIFGFAIALADVFEVLGHVEVGIHPGLAGSGDKVWPLLGAKLGADENRCVLFGASEF
jgi:hypothetical protein